MKLEIGKTYIDRDGDQHTITDIRDGWAIDANSGKSWRADSGVYSPWGGRDCLDLIAEVAPKSGVFAGYAALKDALSHEASQNTPTEMLQGELPCLNVQLGDVVQVHADGQGGLIENGVTFTITSVGCGGTYRGGTGPYQCWLDPRAIFKLISRATPKLWKDMTRQEKAELLLAHHEESVIEMLGNDGTWDTIIPRWIDGRAYRVKPEPEVIEAASGDHIEDTLYRAFYMAVKEERTVTAIHNGRHIEISVKEAK